jgi:phospholipase/carboxylesterase
MLEFVKSIKNHDAPTLFLLHGYGSNMHDLYGLKGYFTGFNLICLQAPRQLSMGGFAWYPIDWTKDGKIIDPADVEHAFLELQESIAWIMQNEGLNGHVILGGFSQGAILCIQAYLKNFRADAYLWMSGYSLPEWANEFQSIKIEKPILQTHGISDPVIPFDWAKTTSTLVQKELYSFKSYTMGHSLNEQCISDIQEFLSQFRLR